MIFSVGQPPERRAVLVPTVVEALVVHAHDNLAWARRRPEYARIFDPDDPVVRGGDLIPDPCTHQDEPLQPGIHLHWALPDALTHGRAEQGDVKFPAIPSRWLVLRRATRPNGGKPVTRGWVVESDYVGVRYDPLAKPPPDQRGPEDLGPRLERRATPPPDQHGSPMWPYMGGARPTSNVHVRWLGRTRDLATYEREDCRPRLRNLTAIGPGDPFFAASYEHSRNVLGMHDALDDLPSDGAWQASYFIAGWYERILGDPLQAVSSAEMLRQRLRELDWVIDDDSGVVAGRTIIHGNCFNVPWGTSEIGAAAGLPRAVRASVGAHEAEAIAALLSAPDSKQAPRRRRAHAAGASVRHGARAGASGRRAPDRT